jgi:hypothetical protein
MKKLLMIIPTALILCFMVGCQHGKEGFTEEEAKDYIEKIAQSRNPTRTVL